MKEATQTDGSRQRLLEGWLPLAQDANLQYGWHLDGPELEALIIAAASALAQSQSLLAARAALWQMYHRQAKDAQRASQAMVAQNGVRN